MGAEAPIIIELIASGWWIDRLSPAHIPVVDTQIKATLRIYTDPGFV